MAKAQPSFVREHVKALDGTSLSFRSLSPKKTKAVAILLHGYAEHGGRYEDMMTALAARGIASYAPDHRGHGQTADVLGYVDDLDAIISDVLLLRTRAEKEHPKSPVFVLGHSMGGSSSDSLVPMGPIASSWDVAAGWARAAYACGGAPRMRGRARGLISV